MRRFSRPRRGAWLVVLFVGEAIVIWGTGFLLLYGLHGIAFAAHEDQPQLPPEVRTAHFSIGEPRAVGVGDFDGDELEDLFLITDTKRPNLFFAMTNPEHQIRFYVISWQGRVPEETRLVSSLPAPERALLDVRRPVVADFDRDGQQDVVVLLTLGALPEPPALVDLKSLESHLLVFWGQGDGTFIEERVSLEVAPIPTISPIPVTMTSGDFDADGLVDLACLDSRNLRLQVFYNQGGRAFSGPYFVALEREDDACLAIPMSIKAAWLDATRPGDDIVVAGACFFYEQDSYGQFIRVLFSSARDCWDLSPILGTDTLVLNFLDALWDIAVKDVDGDEHMDVVLGRPHTAKVEQGSPFVRYFVMGVHLFSGDGRGHLEPLLLMGWVDKGRFLFVDAQPDGGWTVVVLTSDEIGARPRAMLLKASRDLSEVLLAPLPSRGYVVDGVVISRGNSRELVLVASLDFESEVTLVNVVRGW